MIKASEVRKTVVTGEGELTILKGINLEINYGESVAVVGASGSGKTTLLSLLAGLDTPTSGHICLDSDRVITDMDEEARARVRADLVGFVFQTFQLLGSLTAIENVMLPAELRGESGAQSSASELLARVGLSEREKHYPRQLSGGEQQRACIARALVKDPDIILADEPTGNLDPVTSFEFIKLLEEVNREGTTIIMASHDYNLIKGRGHRIIEIQDGSVRQS